MTETELKLFAAQAIGRSRRRYRQYPLRDEHFPPQSFLCELREASRVASLRNSSLNDARAPRYRATTTL